MTLKSLMTAFVFSIAILVFAGSEGLAQEPASNDSLPTTYYWPEDQDEQDDQGPVTEDLYILGYDGLNWFGNPTSPPSSPPETEPEDLDLLIFLLGVFPIWP